MASRPQERKAGGRKDDSTNLFQVEYAVTNASFLRMLMMNFLLREHGLPVVVLNFRNESKVYFEPVQVRLNHLDIIAILFKDGFHLFCAFTGLVYDAHFTCKYGEASFPILHILEIITSE